MTRVMIPQLDANLIDVTLTCWKHSVGDTVTLGETIAELTTDKAVYELEAPASGTLLTILAETKSVVPSGYVIALIGLPGETDPDAEAANRACLTAYRGDSASAAAAPDHERAERVRATPKARRLAKANGLDLEEVQRATGVEVVDEAAVKQFLETGVEG